MDQKKKNLEHQKGRNNLVTKNIGNLGINEITKHSMSWTSWVLQKY